MDKSFTAKKQQFSSDLKNTKLDQNESEKSKQAKTIIKNDNTNSLPTFNYRLFHVKE